MALPRDVKDRVIQYPTRFELVEVSTGIYDLVPVTGTVTEVGTFINKAYLQPVEDELGFIAKDKNQNTDSTYDVDGNLETVTEYWADGTTKKNFVTLTWNLGVLDEVVTLQYDETETLYRTLTETLTYTTGNLTSVEMVVT